MDLALFSHPTNAIVKNLSMKFHNAHVAKSNLRQPIVAKKMNNFPKFQVDEYRTMKAKQINKALEEVIPIKHPAILHDAMRYTLLAVGKRVFGTLCIASCELVGGNESVVMPLACAAELLMTMAVIQDDLPCFDNDDLRRRKPANHNVFGESTTILACQALLCLAIQHIAAKTTRNVSADQLLRAIIEITSAVGSEGISAGQVLDISSEGKEVSLKELELIHRLKCGKFVEAIIVSGVVMGGGREAEIERLREYGKCVGLAYQVVDDILDASSGGDEKRGKKCGRDMVRDKATYPKLLGIDGAKMYADRLLAQANQELAYFDPSKAAPLFHMANFIVSRQF